MTYPLCSATASKADFDRAMSVRTPVAVMQAAAERHVAKMRGEAFDRAKRFLKAHNGLFKNLAAKD